MNIKIAAIYNIEIFMKMISMGLLGIAVGDIDQAIYALQTGIRNI